MKAVENKHSGKSDVADPLVESLRQLEPSTVEEEHPAAEKLAAWIDGVASPLEQEAVEEHVADCRECRDLVAEITATSVDLRARPPARFDLRRVLAVAALALLAFTAWIFFSRLAPWGNRLGEQGLSRWAAVADPDLTRAMRDALDGRWPRLDFEAFADAEGRVILRGAEAPRTPEPLEPRWSAVRVARPALRVAGIGGPLRALVVDGDENVVASFDVAADAVSMPWPADQSALAPGVYAWKLSVENLDLAASSAWVPFEVLGPEEGDRIDAELRGHGPLASAVILARAGLVEEAAERLAEVEDPVARRGWLRGLLDTRALDAELEEREIGRFAGRTEASDASMPDAQE